MSRRLLLVILLPLLAIIALTALTVGLLQTCLLYTSPSPRD